MGAKKRNGKEKLAIVLQGLKGDRSISELCNEATAKQVQDVLKTMFCKLRLVVIPKGGDVSKIGGIYCHLNNRSFLAFLALNNVQDTSANRGLVFSSTLAQELLMYFKGFTDKFER